MPIFRRKPTKVDAEQFTDTQKPPRGVIFVNDVLDNDRFVNGSHVVLTLQGQTVGVKLGEWIVREPSHPERFYPIADEEFRRIYDAVDATTLRASASEEVINMLRPLTNLPYSGHVNTTCAIAIEHITAAAERLNQYRADMLYPPEFDSRERRVKWINELIGDNGLRVKR